MRRQFGLFAPESSECASLTFVCPPPRVAPSSRTGKKNQQRQNNLKYLSRLCASGRVTERFRGKDWKTAGRPVTKVRRCYLSAASAPSSLVLQQGPSFMRSPKLTEAHVISTPTSLRRLIVATSDWRVETSSKQNVWRWKGVRLEPPRNGAPRIISHWNFTRMFKQGPRPPLIVFRQIIWLNSSFFRRYRSQQFVRTRDFIIDSRKCFSSFFFQVTYCFGRGKIKPTKHSTQEHR